MNLNAAEQIMTRAREAQVIWRARKVSERCALLRSFGCEIATSAERLAATIAAEANKPTLDALSGDVLVTLEQIRYYSHDAKRSLKTRSVKKPSLLFRGARFEARLEPHGVALIFGPSNYPFQLSVIPMLTALTAGNAVVLKCSERTPATAAMIVDLCRRAGFPDNLVQVLWAGPEESAALIDARPDFIFFTGSSENGRAVAEHAARFLIPCALELGGKDAAIVFADCHLERAVEGITYGAFSNSGRVCVATKRVYVESSAAQEFLTRLKKRLAQLNVGCDPNVDLRTEPSGLSGVLRSQIDDAMAQGALLEYPERREALDGGPVVLSGVPATARLLTEETFGPVLCVSSFQSEEQGVAAANSSAFALSSSVWTSDRKRAQRVAAQMLAGSCAVNDVIRVIANPFAAFGGNRASGYGRYHGEEGLRTFSRTKTIMIANDRRRREINWFPFTAKTTRQLASIIRFRHGGWRLWRRTSMVVAAAVVMLAFPGSAQNSASTPVSIQVHLAPNAHGQLGFLVFSSSTGFPNDREKAFQRGYLPIRSGSDVVDITTTLPPGTYAVTVYEDLNGNHKLDHNFFGIPREPVGASNNPPGRHGPPRFQECSFHVGNTPQTISIKVVPAA